MTTTTIHTTCSNCRRDVRLDLLEGTVTILRRKFQIMDNDEDLVRWTCICKDSTGDHYEDSYWIENDDEEGN